MRVHGCLLSHCIAPTCFPGYKECAGSSTQSLSFSVYSSFGTACAAQRTPDKINLLQSGNRYRSWFCLKMHDCMIIPDFDVQF